LKIRVSVVQIRPRAPLIFPIYHIVIRIILVKKNHDFWPGQHWGNKTFISQINTGRISSYLKQRIVT